METLFVLTFLPTITCLDGIQKCDTFFCNLGSSEDHYFQYYITVNIKQEEKLKILFASAVFFLQLLNY